MNRWHHQLPVHSPLSAAALLAGLRVVASRNGDQARAEARVVALIKERFGARAVLLTDSGTGALTAAVLAALRADPGPVAPVALPAYACYDVATAADGAGVPVVLYDIDPHTLLPDLTHVQAALRRGARAIVVAHLYGYPIDLAAVNRLASEAGALVIEDAAQAAGATVNGRLAGSQASLTVLSFGRGKGLTGGGGGALLALDAPGEVLLERVRGSGTLGAARRGWSQLATVAGQWLLQRPSLYGVPAALPFFRLGETVYRAPRAVRAAAGVMCPVIATTWALAEQEIDTRRRNAARLLAALRDDTAFQAIAEPPGARPGYLRLPMLASSVARSAVAEPAARRLGVMPGYPRALCDLAPVGQRCVNRDDQFSGSRLLAARLCTFPTHSRLAPRDLARLERWIGAMGRDGDA